MKQLKLIIEKDSDDFLWGRLYYKDDLLTTCGNSIQEVEANMKGQFNDMYDLDTKDMEFDIRYDLEDFFKTNAALNISEIGQLAGISPALMRHYKNGIKYPSAEQTGKIEQVLHKLGKSLMAVSLTVTKRQKRMKSKR